MKNENVNWVYKLLLFEPIYTMQTNFWLFIFFFPVIVLCKAFFPTTVLCHSRFLLQIFECYCVHRNGHCVPFSILWLSLNAHFSFFFFFSHFFLLPLFRLFISHAPSPSPLIFFPFFLLLSQHLHLPRSLCLQLIFPLKASRNENWSFEL